MTMAFTLKRCHSRDVCTSAQLPETREEDRNSQLVRDQKGPGLKCNRSKSKGPDSNFNSARGFVTTCQLQLNGRDAVSILHI